MNGKKILYISYKPRLIGVAQSINTQRRKAAMELAGYSVTEFIHVSNRGIADFFPLIRLLYNVDYVNIRIDGSGILDKFTLLKWFKWNAKIVWEIHGFPDENYPFHLRIQDLVFLTKAHIKRWLLSHFVERYIYISNELKVYSQNKIAPRKDEIIPNFILPGELDQLQKQNTSTMKRYLHQRKFFKVIWAGNTTLDWQATDVIEKTARYIYAIDRSIIFLMVGYADSRQPPATWDKNIIRLGRFPKTTTMRIISIADVCIALYHKPARVPFYFMPLKIIDYMILKKPIVATKFPTIQSLIQHGYNGLLTDNTTADVANNILLLKKNKRYSSRLGINAFNNVTTHHTVTQAATKYQKILSLSAG